MKKSIAKIMAEDHVKLLNILSEVLKKSNNELKQRLFNQFKLNLQKHIFLEEKTIFTHDSLSSDNLETINELLKQHREILELITKIENQMLIEDMTLLRGILKSHVAFENKDLYSILDELLDEEEKENLIKEIKLFLND